MVNKCPGAEPENSEKGWPSLVPRRSLLPHCPRKVYLSVTSQLTVLTEPRTLNRLGTRLGVAEIGHLLAI